MIHIASAKTRSRMRSPTCLPGVIQPNAVDLRVRSISLITDSTLRLTRDGPTEHRVSCALEPIEGVQCASFWHLEENTSYDVLFDGEVSIGDNEAGWVVPRSTLVRNGLTLTSGIYDSGYSGVIGACLRVHGGAATVEVGTRLGQFILFDAEMLSRYEGQYGKGSHHDQQKYG